MLNLNRLNENGLKHSNKMGNFKPMQQQSINNNNSHITGFYLPTQLIAVNNNNSSINGSKFTKLGPFSNVSNSFINNNNNKLNGITQNTKPNTRHAI